MKGWGRGWVTPSALTWRSSMASSSADCALGDARFRSSASRTLVNTGPGRNDTRPLSRSKTMAPVTSEGSRSAVNCTGRRRGRESAGQGFRQRRLAHAGVILHEQVAFGHEAAQRQPDGPVLADVDGSDVRHHLVELAGQPKAELGTGYRRRRSEQAVGRDRQVGRRRGRGCLVPGPRARTGHRSVGHDRRPVGTHHHRARARPRPHRPCPGAPPRPVAARPPQPLRTMPCRGSLRGRDPRR